MNKLIPTAKFSILDAQEQRIRNRRTNLLGAPPTDVRSPDTAHKIAEGFRSSDPTLQIMADLITRKPK